MERFELLNPHSAGIDIGSMLMVVSYTDREGMINLREFDSFTSSLYELAELLQKEGIEKVVMEATGPYWESLYNILEKHGMEMFLVNPSHYRNVSAQKTDINDAQWLHQLLAHGLIRNSHIAPELYRELRQYLHEREIYQNYKSDSLNRMQKTLTLMNIKFQHLISDVEGVAGMKLLRAISSGICDGQTLLARIDVTKLKASPEDLLSSLQGEYKQHYIHILSITLKSYDFFKEQMQVYESHIEHTLKELLACKGEAPTVIQQKTKKVRKNQYSFNLKDYLLGILGVDLTEVEGLDEIGLLTILAVTGTNMKKWPTAEHFVSWLNLSPRPKISGGKIIGYERRNNNNPATQAFRLAAHCLWQSKGPMGQQYRRLASTKGSKKAIKAIARKLAVIFYHMVLNKQAFDATRIQPDIEQQKARKIARLQKDAAKLGMIVQKAA
ncbi:IS110 family RNA-guided transposase [Mucilaginibacter paludis]|nr:IS110 family transposase [Mucilaginibacter paludis]EHQ28051.1 ISPpu9, transposase [Mucilaginibacter paludis DSM 18603]